MKSHVLVRTLAILSIFSASSLLTACSVAPTLGNASNQSPSHRTVSAPVSTAAAVSTGVAARKVNASSAASSTAANSSSGSVSAANSAGTGTTTLPSTSPIEILSSSQQQTQSGYNSGDSLFSFTEQWDHQVHNQVKPQTRSVYSLGTVQHSGNPSNSFYSDPAKGIYYTNRVIVLVFHDMSQTVQSPWNMSPATFATDLKSLQSNHFHVLSNQQFTGWLEHQNSVPDNAVLLTFDDGYASWYSQTLPILQQNHMTGTFFNIVGFIDRGQSGFLTWPEAATMAHDGMSMESHTYNLHYFVKVNGYRTPAFNTPVTKSGKILTPAQYYERDLQDFSKAKSVLQAHTGTVVNQFAWPYGFGNWVSMSAALHSGYQFIYTTMPGIVTPWTNPLSIPRIDVGHSNSTPQLMMEQIFQMAGIQVPAGVKL